MIHDEASISPRFRYHPDPIATGSAEPCDDPCSICGIVRGVRYTGPVYGRQPDVLCLHCIDSGDASRALTVLEEMPAMFTDDFGVSDDVPMLVVEQVTRRTPGFTGWQQPYWLYHCADAAAFLGLAGYRDLEPHPEALAMIRQDLQRLGWKTDEAEQFLQRLDRDGEPTAYLFRCLHCGLYLASWDIG